MFNEKIYNFLKQAGPVFFVTPNLNKAIGLEKELPDFHIICSQESESVGLLRNAGVKVFCVDDRGIKNSGKLLDMDAVVKYINDNSTGSTANIITFKPSPMIEIACQKNGFRYLGNDWRINRDWEDKIKFAQITGDLGVPNANSRIIKVQREELEEIIGRFDFSENEKYVVQFARGQSGNSTFLVKNPKDLENILNKNIGRKIKISDYKEGGTYTFDVCIGKFGTLISQPIFQITGFPELNANKLGSCGNDYSYGERLSDEIKTKTRSYIERVADSLCQSGYQGVLGFDFIISGDRADLIEVNPRLVGSIPVFTKLQIAAGETAFLLLRILSFLEFDFQDMKIEKRKQDFDFSQVILRNTADRPMEVIRAMQSGIYKTGGNGEFVFQRENYFAENLQEDEFFLECMPVGSVVDPDIEYANIQLPYGIMETENSFKGSFIIVKEKILGGINLR